MPPDRKQDKQCCELSRLHGQAPFRDVGIFLHNDYAWDRSAGNPLSFLDDQIPCAEARVEIDVQMMIGVRGQISSQSAKKLLVKRLGTALALSGLNFISPK